MARSHVFCQDKSTRQKQKILKIFLKILPTGTFGRWKIFSTICGSDKIGRIEQDGLILHWKFFEMNKQIQTLEKLDVFGVTLFETLPNFQGGLGKGFVSRRNVYVDVLNFFSEVQTERRRFPRFHKLGGNDASMPGQ